MSARRYQRQHGFQASLIASWALASTDLRIIKASQPVLKSAKRATLPMGDQEIEGVILRGSDISVDVEIFADDRLLDPKTIQREVASASEVLIAAPLPLGTRVMIRNPGGQRSRGAQVTDG